MARSSARAACRLRCRCTSRANETFDIGTDLDSPVSLDYYDQAPFAFNGSIGRTKIMYLKK